jgi:hypothetical protein
MSLVFFTIETVVTIITIDAGKIIRNSIVEILFGVDRWQTVAFVFAFLLAIFLHA